MISDRNKISVRQMFFLLITITFSPSIRWAPIYASFRAKQATWLTPLISMVFMYVSINIFYVIYKRYREASLMQIIEDVLGSFFGKLIIILYTIWIIMLISLYTRYYGERIVSTIMTNTNISVFIVITLVTIGLVLRSGIVVIARMNEIFLPIIVIIFFVLVSLVAPNIELKDLYPISYLEIYPVFKGSFVVTVIWQYFVILLFFSDQINNKEEFKREGVKTLIFLLLVTTITLIVIVGVLGPELTSNVPLPFYEVITQISLFNTLERIESFVVACWVFADFILISAFMYSILRIIKHLLKLEDHTFLINPLMILFYFTTMMITKNRFELEYYSKTILVPINFVFQFIIPVLIFFIAKMRKKV